MIFVPLAVKRRRHTEARMSRRKAAVVSHNADSVVAHDGNPSSVPTTDVASYIAEMIHGLRELTDGRSKDLQFLDYLLALAEDEAETLAAHSFH